MTIENRKSKIENPVVLGTRGSELALAQTRLVQAALQSAHPDWEIKPRIIQTKGDQRLDLSLPEAGALDKGLFTKELEQALVRGEIHAAVHSLKDLPTTLPAGLELAAVLPREDVREVLVTKNPGGLSALPIGAKVGTSSPRREAQLRAVRPDLQPVAIRGNVPTRLRKLAEGGEFDAILLAAAGLKRLGLLGNFPGVHFEILEDFLPAPGQGAVAIESTTEGAGLFAKIHHPETWACVSAERELLRQLGGGCHLALGALAQVDGSELHLRAISFEGGASRSAEAKGRLTEPERVAQQVGAQLI